MKFFFLIFLLVPLIEIYFLIEIGGLIGVGMTILLVVFTALLGAFLVRAQGFATFARVQMQLAQGRLPALEMLEGLLLFFAGALLLTPGFFTDAVGFVLLVPPLRRKIIRHLLSRRVFGATVGSASGHTIYEQTPPGPAHPSGRGRVIDVDHEKID